MYNFFIRRCVKPAFLVASLLITHYAFCWGLTGHRVIAEVAQAHLSKKAKKELQKIIGNETLAWWANWPDFIKSDTSWKNASKWHYVDLPGHMKKEEFIAELKKLPGENLYTQIPAMIAQLKDKSLPVEKRRIALAFLVHFIGDLHQPLHVGRDEDQGGNKITVYWFGEKTNLHSVWDTKIVEMQNYSYTEYAKLLNIAPVAQVTAWQTSPLEDWFYESHVIADSIYDASPNEAKLGYNYDFKFQKVLNQQLLKGGVRLATLINKAFE
jgi:nuclease S1